MTRLIGCLRHEVEHDSCPTFATKPPINVLRNVVSSSPNEMAQNSSSPPASEIASQLRISVRSGACAEPDWFALPAPAVRPSSHDRLAAVTMPAAMTRPTVSESATIQSLLLKWVIEDADVAGIEVVVVV